ncbi:hypothetical protein AB0467_17145 [Streptomyces sp. NPDC052095]
MNTAHEIAARLPDPAELRTHLHAPAVLDATIGDDPAPPPTCMFATRAT